MPHAAILNAILSKNIFSIDINIFQTPIWLSIIFQERKLRFMLENHQDHCWHSVMRKITWLYLQQFSMTYIICRNFWYNYSLKLTTRIFKCIFAATYLCLHIFIYKPNSYLKIATAFVGHCTVTLSFVISN